MTEEPLEAVAARLTAAGHAVAAAESELSVTDPDGQPVAVHPGR